MRLLLDTHIWIWSLSEPTRLSKRVAAELEAPGNELWLSPISTWEALLLIERGRLQVTGTPERVVAGMLAAGPFQEASLTHAVVVESRRIRGRHADPADRFLAATARVYDLTLVTGDHRLLSIKEIDRLANR